MRIKRRIHKLIKKLDVNVEVKLDYDDILFITNDIVALDVALLRKNLKYKKFTKYVEDFDAEIYFDIDDILELVENCNNYEREQILDEINFDKDVIKCETLYDEQKLKVLKKAFEIYDLDELIKKLNIKQL